MSDTKNEVEKLEEVNAAVKDAAPGEATHLKNDAVDMGKAVVSPTDKNPDAASKAKQNTSDPAKKSAKDGSLEKDQKPSAMKEEEVEATEDVMLSKFQLLVDTTLPVCLHEVDKSKK